MRSFCIWAMLAASFCGRGAAGEIEKVSILDLRPTQISVGMIAVSDRIEELTPKLGSGMDKYLKEHPLEVVLGPAAGPGRSKSAVLYLKADHHHRARALWELGVRRVWVRPQEDLSRLSPEKFWKTMRNLGLVYLSDQYGGGPHDPSLLPTDVRGFADDPYRSVAGRVRRKGGYSKVKQPYFQDFFWADFFRKNLTIRSVNDNIDAAVQEALALALSPAASGLPGYHGPARP